MIVCFTVKAGDFFNIGKISDILYSDFIILWANNGKFFSNDEETNCKMAQRCSRIKKEH